MTSAWNIDLPLLQLGHDALVREPKAPRKPHGAQKPRPLPTKCPACDGHGWVRNRRGRTYTRWRGCEGREVCIVCCGSGIKQPRPVPAGLR